MKILLTLFVLFFSTSAFAKNLLLEKSDNIPVSKLDFAFLEIKNFIEQDNKNYFKTMFNLDLSVNLNITDDYERIHIGVKLDAVADDYNKWDKIFNDDELSKTYCSVFARTIFGSFSHLGNRNAENIYKENMIDIQMGLFFVSKNNRFDGSMYNKEIIETYDLTIEEIGKKITKDMKFQINLLPYVMCGFNFNQDYSNPGPTPEIY